MHPARTNLSGYTYVIYIQIDHKKDQRKRVGKKKITAHFSMSLKCCLLAQTFILIITSD